jgi:hypothetical protein
MDGPTGCTGVVIQQGNADYFITNSHIEHFTTGIHVCEEGANLTHLFISNVVCESWTTALMIQPTVEGGQINQVFCSDCVFARTSDSTDTASVGVFIDTLDEGVSSNVSDIYLNNCMVYRCNGPGVQINGGQNIVITGGRYGSNATSQPDSGGIAITGARTASVTINGADCTPQMQGPTAEDFGLQPYALSITAAVAGLYVRGCNLTGYAPKSPIYASSAGTQIEITDCAGYNDQGTTLYSPSSPPVGTFYNTTFSYYGPIAFYVWGTAVDAIKIGSLALGLETGSFNLPCNVGAQVTYSGAPPTFAAIAM